jgi:hypothetical protein
MSNKTYSHAMMAPLPGSGRGKQKVILEGDNDEEMTFQDTKRALKAVYDNSDSDSSTDECYKMLHVMYDGS